MTPFLIGFALLAVIVGTFVFSVLPLGTARRRGIATAAFCISLVVLYFGMAEMLGRAKPVTAELMRLGEAEVVASTLDRGERVYLWLRLPGSKGPRAYWVPWSEELVRQLHEARKKYQRFVMRLPFQKSLERRKSPFHPLPQPKLPDKMGQEPPEIFKKPPVRL